jgi:hypothetical protein
MSDLWDKWADQDAERTAQALPKIIELMGEPTYTHIDGRPGWERAGWQALLGEQFVLFLDDEDAMPSDAALQALGYCFWIGMSIDRHDGCGAGPDDKWERF